MERKDWILNLIKENNNFSDHSLTLYKYKQMTSSPFAFFRATPYLFYQDLQEKTIFLPSEWDSLLTITWIQGDCHLQNIGFLENKDKEIFFDLNDFDEAIISHFYYDLLRFLVSLFLVKQELKFSLKKFKITNWAYDFLFTYDKTIKKIYKKQNKKKIYSEKTLSGFLKNFIYTIKKEKKDKYFFKNWLTPEKKNFIFTQEIISVSKEEKIKIEKAWEKYPSLAIMDIAKVSKKGLASLGLKKYYLLIAGEKKEKPLIIELKEQRDPTLLSFFSEKEKQKIRKLYPTPADICFEAHQKMLSDELFLTDVLMIEDTSFLVRAVSPFKKSLKPKHFIKKSNLKNFLYYAAKVLAYAHTRSSDKENPFEERYLTFIEKNPTFFTIVLEIAKDYAEQVFVDYAIFKDALENKELDNP